MIFRQLFDRESCTYTYIIGDQTSGEAAVIDAVNSLSNRDIQLLTELELTPKYLLETHIHADHITGITNLKEKYPQAQVGVSRHADMQQKLDLELSDGQQLQIGTITLHVLETPGHTNTCLSYYLPNYERVFTGDTLFIRGCGRTDFQAGDAGQLYDSVTQKLFSLPDSIQVYPGHNYKGHLMSTIGEEKRFNPRLGGGKTRAEFIEIMANLKLAQPKLIDVAVPANLRLGQSEPA